MTEGIQTFADNRQTYKANHYINSLMAVSQITMYICPFIVQDLSPEY